jgi:cyclopropane fatty-acyl-phospholipid synthase-like methyltransferase
MTPALPACPPSTPASPVEAERLAAIADYYEKATADYGHWSAGMHMHFGYWRWPLSPFEREPMLDALCDLVHDRLALEPDAVGTVLDLGCGVGSTARRLAHTHAGARVLGLTVAPTQVEVGNTMTRAAGLRERVELITADYRAIPRARGSAIGAYAIESTCYDPDGGEGLIREAARVLEPGARLVVADAFRRRALPRGAQACERNMAAGWVLPGLPSRSEFVAHLDAHGFEVCSVEDASLRVLPTVMHVPLAVASFRLRAGLGLDARRVGHLRSSLWALACALLWPRRFGYLVITARRRVY